MKLRTGSLNEIRLAAKEYEDIFGINKSEKQPGTLIITCFHDYNPDKIKEFTNEYLPLGIDYKIIELNEYSTYHICLLREWFEKTIYEILNEKTIELMHNHSLSYGEAYNIALTHLKKEVIDPFHNSVIEKNIG